MLTSAETCSHRIDPSKRRTAAIKLANSGCMTTRKHAHRKFWPRHDASRNKIAGLLRFRASPALARVGHHRLELAHGEQRFRHSEINRRLQDHFLHLVEGDAEIGAWRMWSAIPSAFAAISVAKVTSSRSRKLSPGRDHISPNSTSVVNCHKSSSSSLTAGFCH